MSTRGKHFARPALGAVLAAVCGLVLWRWTPGEAWVNASYDYLFRFGARSVTNPVVVILMDNPSFDQFHQSREQHWDRALHAELLERLASDGCALVVMDALFRAPDEAKPASDEALASALRKAGRVVLMAEQGRVLHPGIEGAEPLPPCEPFRSAAGDHWGVAWADPDDGSFVRRHWPFPSPGPYASMPETAARLAGAQLDAVPREKWLRYYGENGGFTRLSYRFALAQATNYFRGKIVFIGTQPRNTTPGQEKDEFSTPYTRWTGESVGGVEIMATTFLNLVNADWLRRPAWWIEALTLAASGAAAGWVLCRVRLRTAWLIAAAAALAIALGTVCWSYFTNYWFPWLLIAGGQLPCALACATLLPGAHRVRGTLPAPSAAVALPETPGYKLFHPPFGEGAYGKVWLARNKKGQWQALKVIYESNFGEDRDPYEREFRGINHYQPISNQHPGLLRVDFVSEQRDGYFYYVMELGDPLSPGWEDEPSTYRPRDLVGEKSSRQRTRLPVREVLRIGIGLAEALDFLHQRGYTHRDIKPQNIIFVGGRPKLADMGLVAEIRPEGQPRTLVGTPGYMPPPPELPGTPQADIYSLGMVLYVLSTGRAATFFPEIATTLANSEGLAEYLALNMIILKACDPAPSMRYSSANELRQALVDIEREMDRQGGGV
jgi:CHASE2 domain-containing sensor protein